LARSSTYPSANIVDAIIDCVFSLYAIILCQTFEINSMSAGNMHGCIRAHSLESRMGREVPCMHAPLARRSKVVTNAVGHAPLRAHLHPCVRQGYAPPGGGFFPKRSDDLVLGPQAAAADPEDDAQDVERRGQLGHRLQLLLSDACVRALGPGCLCLIKDLSMDVREKRGRECVSWLMIGTCHLCTQQIWYGSTAKNTSISITQMHIIHDTD
jgi:hypothetical protein